MKLKKVLALTCAGAMTLSMAACGKTSATDGGNNKNSGTDSVSLTMWAAEEDQEMYRKMAESFIELHKGEVDLTIEIGVESESTVKDTILADVEGAADVYSFADDQIVELVQAGALMAIPEEMNLDDVVSRNVAGSVTAATVDGKVYAYPRTADNGYFLFYSKEYFTEDDVTSWEKMLAVAAKAGKQVSMEMNSGWYMNGFFSAVGLTATLDEDMKTTICDWNSTTNSVKGVQVAEKMLEICKHEGFVALEDAEFVTGIKDGSVIAGINGTWNAEAAKEAWGDNYAATKLPTFAVDGEDYQMYTYAGYKMVGVNPHCENAGWALMFADYITNEENQVTCFELRGVGPSNINAGASDEVKANPAIAAFSSQLEWSLLQRVGSNFWTPTETFGQTLQDGNPEGTELQTLLDDMVAAITAAVE